MATPQTEIILISNLTCPFCGNVATQTMPTDYCQWFYTCIECKKTLRPKPGDCCVYCSYGTAPCPPMQETGGCC